MENDFDETPTIPDHIARLSMHEMCEADRWESIAEKERFSLPNEER